MVKSVSCFRLSNNHKWWWWVSSTVHIQFTADQYSIAKCVNWPRLDDRLNPVVCTRRSSSSCLCVFSLTQHHNQTWQCHNHAWQCHMSDVIMSCVKHYTVTCQLWQCHSSFMKKDITMTQLRHDNVKSQTQSHMPDMTTSHIWHDNVTRWTLHCHMSDVTMSCDTWQKDMTMIQARHDNVKSQTKSHMPDMTTSYIWHDNVTRWTLHCTCQTWQCHVWYMTKRHDNDTSKTWQCHVLNITMSHVLNNITFNDLWLTACSSKHPSLSFVVYCVCLTGYIVYVSMKMRNWYHWHITMTPCCSHGYR